MARDTRNSRGRNQGHTFNQSVQVNGWKQSKDDKPKKTLSDHIYYVGLAKNVSECIANTKFILNHIELTFDEGLDIAQAMRNGQEFNFDDIKPELEASRSDPAHNRAQYNTETEQFKLEFKIKYEAKVWSKDQPIQAKQDRSLGTAMEAMFIGYEIQATS